MPDTDPLNGRVGVLRLTVECRVASLSYTLSVAQRNAPGSVLQRRTYNQLNLEETDYFGLRYLDEREQPVRRLRDCVCVGGGKRIFLFLCWPLKFLSSST